MRSAKEAIKSGLEYAMMCLAEHERTLGRTRLKDRLWAERMETDIKAMTAIIDQLPPYDDPIKMI